MYPQARSVRVIHDHPVYLICPDLLIAVGETSYRIQVGFIWSTVFTICLCICILGVKSTLIQLCTQKSYSHNRQGNIHHSPPEITPLFLLTTLYTTSLILLAYSIAVIHHPIPLSAANSFSHVNLSVTPPTDHQWFLECMLVIWIYNGWLQTARNWGRQSLYVINKYTKMFSYRVV